MASQHPGFPGTTNEGISLHEPGNTPPSSKMEAEYMGERGDPKAKPDVYGEEVNHSGMPNYDEHDGGINDGEVKVMHSAEDLMTNVIDVDDDPSLNPWTFRMWFL